MAMPMLLDRILTLHPFEDAFSCETAALLADLQGHEPRFGSQELWGFVVGEREKELRANGWKDTERTDHLRTVQSRINRLYGP
jgi:hypothetical protein